MTAGYIVADEWDYVGPFKNRTDARKECDRWKREGRDAEILRRLPPHLTDKQASIMPRFYDKMGEW